MPKGKGKTFRFFDGDGEVYSFYAVNENKAIRYALDWSRRTGIKLFRRRPK